MLTSLSQSAVVGLPAILFVCSLHRLFLQMQSGDSSQYLGRLWVTLYCVIQLFATVWLAGALSALSPQLHATEASIRQALSTGPYLLGGLLSMLYFRDIAVALGTLCRRALGGSPDRVGLTLPPQAKTPSLYEEYPTSSKLL